jgi:rare lipoprotein A
LRAVAEAISGALLVVAFAAAVLFYTVPAHAAPKLCGTASWYGPESGNTTANGEHFNPDGLTAAMPSRKHLGERYRVHYGHSSVVVRVNDVGPRADLHRIMDLSRGAAKAIGLIGRGVGTVCLERL